MAIEKMKILGADYSFYVKSIATYASTFFGYNNSVLASVRKLDRCCVADFNPLGYGNGFLKNDKELLKR